MVVDYAILWEVMRLLAGFVASVAVSPIYPIALTLLYYDQRIRREGFDVEWMMQSAGLVPAPPTAEPPSAAPVEDMPA